MAAPAGSGSGSSAHLGAGPGPVKEAKVGGAAETLVSTIDETITVMSSGRPPPHRMSFSLARIAKGESVCRSSESSCA